MAAPIEKIPSVSCVMECIKILVSPDRGPTGSSHAQDQASRFDATLSSNIGQLHTVLKNDPKYQCLLTLLQDIELEHQADEVRFKFTLECLRLIKCLKLAMVEAMKQFRQSESGDSQSAPRLGSKSQSRVRQDDVAPPLPPDTLSIAQQKTLATAMQFVVCLGICPNLLPGVGIPLERRSGFGKMLQTSQADSDSLSEKTIKLFNVLEVLLDCMLQPVLGSQILSKHLGDMLSALIQIYYGPRPCTVLKDSTVTEHDNYATGTSSCSTESSHQKSKEARNCDKEGDCASDKNQTRQKEGQVKVVKSGAPLASISPEMYEKCSSNLHRLLEKVYQPLVVRELLQLQAGSRATAGPKGGKGQMSRTPLWLKKACGQLLSERLIKPGGVEAVLKGSLAGGLPAMGMTSESVEWKRCDAIARLIATCPQQCTSKEHYYKLICPQILDLINSKDQMMANAFLRVASVTMATIVSQHPLLANQYLLNPLLKPLVVITGVCDEDTGDPVIVEESSLTRCIENVHRVFVLGSEPGSRLVVSLCPVIHPLFQLLCFTKRGVSHLRSRVEDILVAFLKGVDPEMGCTYLWHITTRGGARSCLRIPVMNYSLQFAPGPTGGAVVVKSSSNVQLPPLLVPETEGNMSTTCICDLLEKLETEEIPGDFFVSVLKELTAIIRELNVNDEMDSKLTADQTKAILEIEGREAVNQQYNARVLLKLQLLGAMCERLGPSVLRSTIHVVQFVGATLQRSCELEFKKASPIDGQSVLDTDETLCLAMGLIAAVMGGAMEVKEEDKEHFEQLVPWLEQLRSRHTNPAVKEMAEDLLIAIRTHCAVVMKTLDPSAKNLGQKATQAAAGDKEGETEKRPNTDSQTSFPTSESNTAGNQEGSRSKEGVTVISTKQKSLQNKAKATEGVVVEDTDYDYNEALALAKHPLVPMRGHGLIALSSLLERKDSKALEDKDKLLKLFEENLDHEDSYIYLASIRGLSALGTLFPDVVVPKLCAQFGDFRQEGRRKTSAEDRMKLGEILTKVTRSLGDLVPHYSQPLLAALLCGVRDPDAHVRASSLANLGEVCHLLRFSVGPIVHEIFACLSGVLRSEHDPTVRSAAVTVVTQLLRGLGLDAIKVLDSVLLDLYRLLKHMRDQEEDMMSRIHYHEAWAEITKIMMQFAFPEQTLEKKIHVLP